MFYGVQSQYGFVFHFLLENNVPQNCRGWKRNVIRNLCKKSRIRLKKKAQRKYRQNNDRRLQTCTCITDGNKNVEDAFILKNKKLHTDGALTEASVVSEILRTFVPYTAFVKFASCRVLLFVVERCQSRTPVSFMAVIGFSGKTSDVFSARTIKNGAGNRSSRPDIPPRYFFCSSSAARL